MNINKQINNFQISFINFLKCSKLPEISSFQVSSVDPSSFALHIILLHVRNTRYDYILYLLHLYN